MLSGCYRRQDLFVHKVIPENIEKWKSNAVNVKLLVKIFFPHVEKYLKDNKHNSLHLAQIILVYLSVNNICSLNLTVFLKLCFLKTTICAYFGIKWRPLFIYLRLIDIFICVCILTYIKKIPCTLTFISYWIILMLKFSCLNKVYCSTVKLPNRHYYSMQSSGVSQK